VSSDPRHLPTPGAEGIRSELAVPILLGERVLGVLNVESGDPFDEEDEAGLRIVADQLAVAIENARLYRRGQRLAVLEERQRLARDLHDSVTQHIFGMGMIAESLASAFRRSQEEGERRAARLTELSRTALAEMRALLAELRPAGAPMPTETLNVLPDMVRVRRDGIEVALDALAERMSVHEVPVVVERNGYQRQPGHVEEALFRIAQEAVNNAVKHARARRVRIQLSGEGGTLRLTVVDDGCGFDPATDIRAGGLGLTSMRERAAALGGTVRIETKPGAGTRVEVTVPAAEVTSP